MYPHSMIAMPSSSSSSSSFATSKYRTSDAVPVEFDQTVVVMGNCSSSPSFIHQHSPSADDEVEAMERSRIPLGTADGGVLSPKKTLASSSSSHRWSPLGWWLRLAIIFLLLLLVLGGAGVAVLRFGPFENFLFPPSPSGTKAMPVPVNGTSVAPTVAPVGTTTAAGVPTRSPSAPTRPCRFPFNCTPAIPSVETTIPPVVQTPVVTGVSRPMSDAPRTASPAPYRTSSPSPPIIPSTARPTVISDSQSHC
jgi:hypothetical protein